MTYTDKLTGLKNQSMFEKDVTNLINKEEPFTVYLVDIDNFRKLNDIHGYQYGDIFLKQYSWILLKGLENCNVYRWSGDAFLIIEKTNSTERILNFLMTYSKKRWVWVRLSLIIH